MALSKVVPADNLDKFGLGSHHDLPAIVPQVTSPPDPVLCVSRHIGEKTKARPDWLKISKTISSKTIYNVLKDKVFFSALLTSSATVSVSIGGVSQAATWRNVPYGNVGVFHGSALFNGRTGTVVVTVSKSGSKISMTGQAISATCANGIQNWNPWVGGAIGGTISAVSTPKKFSDLKCIEGTGVGGKAGLCSFSCRYNYCPAEACTCLAMGDQIKEPTALKVNGYPIAAVDTSYSGLCSYACNRGYCPSTACSSTKVPLSLPPQEGPFPVCWKQVCVKGTGPGNLLGLCDFSCNFGFCPSVCTCTAQGPPNTLPATVNVRGWPKSGNDGGLCAFTCSHGYCPNTACFTSSGIFFELSPPPEVTANAWCTHVEGSSNSTDTVWRRSAAGHVLDQIVSRDGPKDIDDTLKNYSGLSVINCHNPIDTGNCVGGAECPKKWDIAIAYHYIQKAFVNYHAVLNGLHTMLLASTLINSIEIQPLIDDLALELVESYPTEDKGLSIVAGVFGTASSALGLAPNPIFGAVSGVIGGAVGFAKELQNDPADDEEDYVKDTAKFLNNRLVNTFLTLFFNPTNEENWAYKTEMGKFFADGKYALPISDYLPFQDSLRKYIKESLISGLMTSSLIYITVDAFDLESCAVNDGYTLDLDGTTHCYTLERPTRAGADRINEGVQREWLSVPLGRTAFSHDILYTKYGINDQQIFRGSYECQKAKADYGGLYDFSDTVAVENNGNPYSKCFWNLPLIYVRHGTGYAQDSTPCWIKGHYKSKETGGKVGSEYLPESLAKRFIEMEGYCP
ncbi:hypothetical protein BKA65DRAFT_598423 [Rhexocercosporidium sp. MPI-PUGE-AT-0058]|nr:hypothetical protein BKA65DRAFT_598423 [Rhexocercosporidium sp. MPI-PUGE-AT-0058]